MRNVLLFILAEIVIAAGGITMTLIHGVPFWVWPTITGVCLIALPIVRFWPSVNLKWLLKLYREIMPIPPIATPSEEAKKIGIILWTKIAKTHELVIKVHYWGANYKTSGHFPPSFDIGDAINDLRPYLIAMGTTDIPEKYLDEADVKVWYEYLKTLMAQRPSDGDYHANRWNWIDRSK